MVPLSGEDDFESLDFEFERDFGDVPLSSGDVPDGFAESGEVLLPGAVVAAPGEVVVLGVVAAGDVESGEVEPGVLGVAGGDDGLCVPAGGVVD